MRKNIWEAFLISLQHKEISSSFYPSSFPFLFPCFVELGENREEFFRLRRFKKNPPNYFPQSTTQENEKEYGKSLRN